MNLAGHANGVLALDAGKLKSISALMSGADLIKNLRTKGKQHETATKTIRNQEVR